MPKHESQQMRRGHRFDFLEQPPQWGHKLYTALTDSVDRMRDVKFMTAIIISVYTHQSDCPLLVTTNLTPSMCCDEWFSNAFLQNIILVEEAV